MAEKANHKMAVSPLEAAEASAASANATPESISLASCGQFNPPPKFPAEWWSANKNNTPFTGADELLGPGIANEDAWVAITMLGIKGNWKSTRTLVGTVFPSAADVMLWLRHDILASELVWRKANNFNCRGINKLVDIIESLDSTASWSQFLGQIECLFCREYYKTEILRWIPIHTVLDSFAEKAERESDDEFLAISRHPEVSRQGSRWQMPQTHWNRVNEFIVSRS